MKWDLGPMPRSNRRNASLLRKFREFSGKDSEFPAIALRAMERTNLRQIGPATMNKDAAAVNVNESYSGLSSCGSG
jgi:hypothetical protein